MDTRHWRHLTVVALAFALGCSAGDKADSADAAGSDDGGADDGASDDGGADDGGADDGASDDGGSDDGGSDDGGSDDGGSDGTADVDWDSLNGEVPSNPVSAPEFAATNLDGSARAREDLLGHPTVMWFYPAAATAG